MRNFLNVYIIHYVHRYIFFKRSSKNQACKRDTNQSRTRRIIKMKTILKISIINTVKQGELKLPSPNQVAQEEF